MTTDLRTCLLAFALGFLFLWTPQLFSYTLVLKNGRTMQGTLVSETDELIVLQDNGGIRMNFKKTAVDLEKTSAANKVETPPTPPTPPAATEEKQEPPSTPPTPKKKGRVITEKDLEKYHDYDLGEGTFGEGAPAGESGSAQEKGEAEWRGQAQDLLNQVKQAEDIYNKRKQDCERLKGVTIQTHVVVEKETGKTLDMMQTTQQVCQEAEDARAQYEQARQSYQNFREEARKEVVPPGYIRTDDEEYEKKLEEQQEQQEEQPN